MALVNYQEDIDDDVDDDLDDEPTLLSYEDNLLISNFIMHEACQLYYHDFKKKWLPVSFIEFLFDEFSNYAFVGNEPVKLFFSMYSIDDIPLIVENYQYNYYSLICEKKNRKSELCYLIKPNEYMGISLSNKLMLGAFNPAVYTMLENITNHIKDNDELLNIRELYEAYMIKKIVLSSTGKQLGKKREHYSRPAGVAVKGPTPKKGEAKVEKVDFSNAATQAAATGTAPTSAGDPTLYGAATDLPNQKGRVVKLFFPRLRLPSPYPVLQDKSRINSEHRVGRFLSNDRQITLINKHKFNAIKYKTGFIEKRKAAAKPPKRKFDFDF